MPPLAIVDAFTARPSAGNPAAVVTLDEPAPEAWMQAVAAEMNLSETAFVTPDLALRWFTPKAEVSLCGHATLAAAHVLWEDGRTEEELPFGTASGTLPARRRGEEIVLDFPARPADRQAPGGAEGLVPGGVLVGATATGDVLVELPDAAAVEAVRPDLGRLAALPVRGLIVTAPGDGAPYDCVSRFFAPAVGVPEDPVTGSAHCTLAPHWAARLGRRKLHARQASARGGELGLELSGDRVLIAGSAVTVVRGATAGPAGPRARA